MIRWFRRLTLGQRGERFAARQLRRWGYRVLERNVRLGRYEIDIIAREGNTIAFVEVKTRRSADVASPEVNVTIRDENGKTVEIKTSAGFMRVLGNTVDMVLAKDPAEAQSA